MTGKRITEIKGQTRAPQRQTKRKRETEKDQVSKNRKYLRMGRWSRGKG